MKKSTKDEILKMLDDAKGKVNEAFEMLGEQEQNQCDHFAGLTCDMDEAIAEVKELD